MIIQLGQVTPSCDEVIKKMGVGNKYFLSLDFSSGYWQVGISPETRGVTAFITECRKYVWNVLPQGLQDSSDHFLHIMDDMLQRGELKNYMQNFDDI